LIVDLGEVYVDSAGLGALIAARASALHQRAELELANLTTSLRDQPAITKLVTAFDVFDSVDAAVKSFPPKAVASEKFWILDFGLKSKEVESRA